MDLQYGKACVPTLKRFDDSGLVLQVGKLLQHAGSRLWHGLACARTIPGQDHSDEICRQSAQRRHFPACRGRLHAERQFQSAFPQSPKQIALPHGARALADRPAFPGRLQGDEAVRRFHVLDRGTARIQFRRRLSWRTGTRRGPAARPAFLRSRSLPNCIALNLSFPWTPDAEARLKAIGELVREHA